MSIKKIDDLKFEHEFPGVCDINDMQDLEFKEEGLEIGYDVLSWEDIKTAYKKIFKEQWA